MSKPKTYPFNPDWSLPPGEMIRERLEVTSESITSFAKRMRRPLEQMSRLINGRIRLTEATALDLERVFGTPAQYWMNIETRHRLHLARKKVKK